VRSPRQPAYSGEGLSTPGGIKHLVGNTTITSRLNFRTRFCVLRRIYRLGPVLLSTLR
jgi:hypothetical protein